MKTYPTQQILKLIFQYSFSLILIACNSKHAIKQLSKKTGNDTLPTVIKMLPSDYMSWTLEKYQQWLEDSMNLSSMKTNPLNLEIRITEDKRDTLINIYSIRDSADYWSAKLIRLKSLYSAKGNLEGTEIQQIVLSSPRNGWKTFKSLLNRINFDKLLSYQTPKNRFDTEQTIHRVEIMKDGRYSNNVHTNSYQKSDYVSHEVLELISLIKSEFEI